MFTVKNFVFAQRSSWLAGMEYFAKRQQLVVLTLDGDVYLYSHVSQAVYDELHFAATHNLSVGALFNKLIVKKYSCWKLVDTPNDQMDKCKNIAESERKYRKNGGVILSKKLRNR